MDVHEYFGGIDIYLFDQIQKGTFKPDMKILDVGCGNGRNLVYFMRNDYDVYGVDSSESQIKNCKFLVQQLTHKSPENNFRVEFLDNISFEDSCFDAIISSAAFHFAKDDRQFNDWLYSAWRVLKVGGFMFTRLASSIGIEDKIKQIEGRRYHLPDTTDRYLVDEELLLSLTKKLGAELTEPIKTTNVQNLRAMTTWCIRKLASPKTTDGTVGGLNNSDSLKLYRE